VNGDPLRGFILGGARAALGEWYATLQTRRVIRQYSNVAAAELIAEKLMQLLSMIPWSVAVVLTQLSWRDSQRAEYYADELAASVAGNEATARALEKGRLSGTLRLAAQQAVHRRDSGDAGDLLLGIRAKVDAMPPRERERLHRIELLPGGVADTTHPLTAYRIEFVRSLPERSPLVTCTAERSDVIDAELAPFRPEVERVLKEGYRASITR
jgi:Zn-dependent protease with chaperone function